MRGYCLLGFVLGSGLGSDVDPDLLAARCYAGPRHSSLPHSLADGQDSSGQCNLEYGTRS